MEPQRANGLKKNFSRASGTSRIIIKHAKYMSLKFQEGGKKRMALEKYLENTNEGRNNANE